MCHALHCVDDSTWPINFWTNRYVGLLCYALAANDLFSFLTAAETMLVPFHGNGTYWYGCCRPSDLQDHWAGGTSAQQKYFCFRKISWGRGHQLALRSVLNTSFLLGTLRMDPTEVLWQEPNLDPPFWHCFTKWPAHFCVHLQTNTRNLDVLQVFYVSICILTESKRRICIKKQFHFVWRNIVGSIAPTFSISD